MRLLERARAMPIFFRKKRKNSNFFLLLFCAAGKATFQKKVGLFGRSSAQFTADSSIGAFHHLISCLSTSHQRFQRFDFFSTTVQEGRKVGINIGNSIKPWIPALENGGERLGAHFAEKITRCGGWR